MTLSTLPENPLEGIDLVIFDYDNTLYHANKVYSDKVNALYGEYLVRNNITSCLKKASRFAREAYLNLGHTCFGFTDKGICPEAYSQWIHSQIIERKLKEKHILDAFIPETLLSHIKMKKIVFTQGYKQYAIHGLNLSGLAAHIQPDDVYGFDTVGIHVDNMKHNQKTWKMLADKYGVPYECVAVVEDSADYLKPPHELGMRTIFVKNDQYFHFNFKEVNGEHIDYSYETTEEFLKSLT